MELIPIVEGHLIRPETDYDRAKEVKEFDNTKGGVKGLVDSGVTNIPRFFVHRLESLQDSPFDIQGSQNGRRKEIVEEIRRVSETWGFFQVVNHGISVSIMDEKFFPEYRFEWLVSEFAKAISQELEWMASARDENSEPLPEEPNPLVNAPHVCFIRFSGALIGSIFGFVPSMFSFRFEVGEVRNASCGVVCSEVASCVSANTGKPQILQTKA
ncbi:Non-hem dioxygenase N-terminal domain [Dillenia turbinata]|uniref:Non-hem dioxygenase N-terminal domain n=1 Tax=Dillenia turbinata TaxID=194707 RepID=A0AAN8ZH43_9MAGN